MYSLTISINSKLLCRRKMCFSQRRLLEYGHMYPTDRVNVLTGVSLEAEYLPVSPVTEDSQQGLGTAAHLVLHTHTPHTHVY